LKDAGIVFTGVVPTPEEVSGCFGVSETVGD
jgi:hypothetical protein